MDNTQKQESGKKSRKRKTWLQEESTIPEITDTSEITKNVLKETSGARVILTSPAQAIFPQEHEEEDESTSQVIEQMLDSQPLPAEASEWELFIQKLPKSIARAMFYAGLFAFEDLKEAQEKDLLIPAGPFTAEDLIKLRAIVESVGREFAAKKPTTIVATVTDNNSEILNKLHNIIHYRFRK